MHKIIETFWAEKRSSLKSSLLGYLLNIVKIGLTVISYYITKKMSGDNFITLNGSDRVMTNDLLAVSIARPVPKTRCRKKLLQSKHFKGHLHNKYTLMFGGVTWSTQN